MVTGEVTGEVVSNTQTVHFVLFVVKPLLYSLSFNRHLALPSSVPHSSPHNSQSTAYFGSVRNNRKEEAINAMDFQIM